MNSKEILSKIYHNKFYNEKNKKWISKEDDIEIKYGIIYGDDGGDSFLKEFDNEENFNKGLQSHIIDKNTGCDFLTYVSLIIKDGKEYTPKIS